MILQAFKKYEKARRKFENWRVENEVIGCQSLEAIEAHRAEGPLIREIYFLHRSNFISLLQKMGDTKEKEK